MVPSFFAELKILFSQYDLFFPSHISASINAAKAFSNVSFFSSGRPVRLTSGILFILEVTLGELRRGGAAAVCVR